MTTQEAINEDDAMVNTVEPAFASLVSYVDGLRAGIGGAE